MDIVQSHRGQRVVYYILGVIDVLLGLRLLFKLLGANASNGFISFIYSLTKVFILPFLGIFSTVSSVGSVFEPATAIAMIIYAIIAYGIVSLLKL